MINELTFSFSFLFFFFFHLPRSDVLLSYSVYRSAYLGGSCRKNQCSAFTRVNCPDNLSTVIHGHGRSEDFVFRRRWRKKNVNKHWIYVERENRKKRNNDNDYGNNRFFHDISASIIYLSFSLSLSLTFHLALRVSRSASRSASRHAVSVVVSGLGAILMGFLESN